MFCRTRCPSLGLVHRNGSKLSVKFYFYVTKSTSVKLKLLYPMGLLTDATWLDMPSRKDFFPPLLDRHPVG